MLSKQAKKKGSYGSGWRINTEVTREGCTLPYSTGDLHV